MRTRRILAFVLAVVLAAGGCSRRQHPVAPAPIADEELTPRGYLCRAQPMNVIANLEAAYANRDIDAYRELFAPEFVFRFQPEDARELGRASWGLEDELRSAQRLFESSEVKRVVIRLAKLSVAPATERGLEHTMRVVVAHTFLRIERAGKSTLQVNGDRQEFYLREVVEQGESRWLIVEWRDLPPAVTG
jgi:hypothetical protein